MKPYYADDAVTIYHGDCRDIVPTLGRFDLICADPPYGKVKGTFDEEWTNRPAMLKDCETWRDMMVGAMKPNATLYWFAWPSLAGRIEALIAEKLNPLSHIVWIKPTPHAQKQCPEFLRAPGPETERILMAEHYGADNMALGESGYVRKCDEARGFIFEPLRAYLAAEMERAGFDNVKVNAAWRAVHGGGGGMASHWFTTSQWALPTAKNYAWLQGLFNAGKDYEYLRKDYEDLRKDYEDLRKDYEDLRKDYEDLRRYFDMHTGDQKTDVWRFSPETERLGHPTQKPLPLISYIVRLSCRPGGTILDPFAGSGTTGRAAKDLGRNAVLIEREEKYCEIAARRMQQECLPLTARAPEPTEEQTALAL
jgi:site-specific DNA-methyltransferase (adenine-specific)